MPVQAGTAYIKVDADFSTFERQLHERIRQHVTQRVEPQLNEAGLREQVRVATRPVQQDVHMRLDQASMQKTEGEAKGFFGRIGTAGKLALGGAAVFVGAQIFDAIGEQIKSATDSTLALGRAADTLHQTAGLSQVDAAHLVASANALDIPTRTLGVSLKQLSAQYVGAESGSKKARGAFKELGITQKELNDLSRQHPEAPGHGDRAARQDGGGRGRRRPPPRRCWVGASSRSPRCSSTAGKRCAN